MHHRSFVWGSDAFNDTVSLADGEFVVNAAGGIRFSPATGGCTLTSGASGWSCASDRALKSHVTPADVGEILSRVIVLPIARWEFAAVPGIVHVGPMAQDFHAAFGLGNDPKRLAPMDVQGVALAAIQGLNAKLQAQMADKDPHIAALRSESEALKREMADLRAASQKEMADLRLAVEVLMARTAADGRVAQTR